MKAVLIIGMLATASCYIPSKLEGGAIGEVTYISKYVKRVVDRETGVTCYVTLGGKGISCTPPVVRAER